MWLFFSINTYNIKKNEKEIWIAVATVWSVTEKNVTNRELALRVGISEQQIGKYVNQKAYPSLPRLHEIADALELRVKDLFAPIN